MCEASYTVGPQLYQFTLLPCFGTNISFFLVKLLNSFKRHVSETSPLDQAGCVRFGAAITGTYPTSKYDHCMNSSRQIFFRNTYHASHMFRCARSKLTYCTQRAGIGRNNRSGPIGTIARRMSYVLTSVQITASFGVTR